MKTAIIIVGATLIGTGVGTVVLGGLMKAGKALQEALAKRFKGLRPYPEAREVVAAQLKHSQYIGANHEPSYYESHPAPYHQEPPQHKEEEVTTSAA